MNRNPIITCAVTGAGGAAGRHSDLPATPTQIAAAALEAAWVVQSIMPGGHIRLGPEDNLCLARGARASNADLVRRAGEAGRGRQWRQWVAESSLRARPGRLCRWVGVRAA